MNKMHAHDLTVKYAEVIDSYFKNLSLGCNTCTSTCCGNFANSSGWFDYEEYRSKSHTELSKAIKRESEWNDKRGYLGKKGCTLPRHMRSAICNWHICNNSVGSNINSFAKQNLKVLAESIQLLNCYIYADDNKPTTTRYSPTLEQIEIVANLICEYGIETEIYGHRGDHTSSYFEQGITFNAAIYNGKFLYGESYTKKVLEKNHRYSINRSKNMLIMYNNNVDTIKQELVEAKNKVQSQKQRLKELRDMDAGVAAEMNMAKFLEKTISKVV